MSQNPIILKGASLLTGFKYPLVLNINPQPLFTLYRSNSLRAVPETQQPPCFPSHAPTCWSLIKFPPPGAKQSDKRFQTLDVCLRAAGRLLLGQNQAKSSLCSSLAPCTPIMMRSFVLPSAIHPYISLRLSWVPPTKYYYLPLTSLTI